MSKYLKYLILFIGVLFHNETSAQGADSTRVTYFGFLLAYDLSYNSPTKVLGSGLERKMSFGVRFSNKKRSFMTFAAVGFKGAKLNVYSPKFRNSFITDLQNDYNPIQYGGEDSLIGSLMNNGGNRMWGTYSQYLHFGVSFLNRYRPTLSLHFGREQFLLHDDKLRKYVDPEHGDIDYVALGTSFYEVKFGFAIPYKNWHKNIYAPNISIGYEFINHKGLSFDSTPMEIYTSSEFVQKYNRANKLTIALTFYLW